MKCTKEAMQKVVDQIIGMEITDEQGNVIGKVISAEFKAHDVHVTADVSTVIEMKKYIQFNLGLEAVE